MGYSYDLQIRIAHIYNNEDISLRKLAKLLNVGKESIRRWSNIYQTTVTHNEISAEKIHSTHNNDKYTKNIEQLNKICKFLKRSLNYNPFQTLIMLADKVNHKFGIEYSTKTMSNYLKLIGYSKKRITKRFYNKTLKQHKLDRKLFKKKLKTINKEDIICVDESGINRKTYATSGWCSSNKRLMRYKKIT